MLIDLHVHTTRYSGCARSTPEAMVERAIEVGLGGLVITEHQVVWSRDELAELQARYPRIKLFRGVEVTSAAGDDYLVYGISGEGGFNNGMLATEIIERTHTMGGLVVLAHPYRNRPAPPELGDCHHVDGLEVMSIHVLNYAHRAATELSSRWGAFPVSSSDSHHVDTLGLYAMRLMEPVSTDGELVDQLRRRRYTLYADRARLEAENNGLVASLDQARGLIAEGLADETVRQRVPSVSMLQLQWLRQGQDVFRPIG